MLETVEAENSKLIEQVYGALNSLDVQRFVDYFFDDAALISLNDTVPPMVGKTAITEFFTNFFENGKHINFEIISTPHALGNLVTFKHIDHFEFDGVMHDDNLVSAVLIIDGKIKKWLGYLQSN